MVFTLKKRLEQCEQAPAAAGGGEGGEQEGEGSKVKMEG